MFASPPGYDFIQGMRKRGSVIPLSPSCIVDAVTRLAGVSQRSVLKGAFISTDGSLRALSQRMVFRYSAN